MKKTILTFMISILIHDLFAAGNMRSWGDSVSSQGTSIAISWTTGGMVLAGLASILGLQFAYSWMGKIVVGAALVFGAGTVVSLLRNIFN